MKFGFRFALVALLAFWPAASIVRAQPAAQPPTIEELTAQGRISRVEASPSGRYLGIVRRNGDLEFIQIIDLQTRTQSTITTITTDKSFVVEGISDLHWKSEDRLVYEVRGYRLIVRREIPVPTYEVARGLVAVNRDGSKPMILPSVGLINWLDREPNHLIFMGRDEKSPGRWRKAMKADLTTGELSVLDAGDGDTWGWEASRNGELILRYESIGLSGGVKVLGKDGAGWRELFRLRLKDFRMMPELEVVAPGPEPTKVYVAVRPEHGTTGDTRELRLYDFATKTMGPKLWGIDGYDFDAVIFDEHTGEAAGLCYRDDVLRCDFKDPRIRKDYAAMVDRFGAGSSVAIHSRSTNGDVMVLFVHGPTNPGSFHVYFPATGKVETLGAQHPSLKPERLSTTTRLEWKSSDGLTLSGYLTTPRFPRGGKIPLVVMPHGGPEARDHLAFDAWAQAFAARGYAVFQPNFRGSGGFGTRFAALGHGQWGLRMQDDVMEGLQAVIDGGQIDPERICAVGGSYGGYVALFAGAKAPERFKCVVSFAGVSDLVDIQRWQKSQGGADSPTYQYWLKSIGDPDKDRDRLVATSPITYAKSYGPPVLLIHGARDFIVPIAQSRDMAVALKKAGRPVRLIEYEREGHNNWSPQAEAEVLGEMVKFVDAAIGAPK